MVFCIPGICFIGLLNKTKRKIEEYKSTKLEKIRQLFLPFKLKNMEEIGCLGLRFPLDIKHSSKGMGGSSRLVGNTDIG